MSLVKKHVPHVRPPVPLSSCCVSSFCVSSFCVSCPGFPDKKKVFFLFFSGVEGKSDGLKWCSHKVISAHMLECTAGNRP